jgi:hypothetical protein
MAQTQSTIKNERSIRSWVKKTAISDEAKVHIQQEIELEKSREKPTRRPQKQPRESWWHCEYTNQNRLRRLTAPFLHPAKRQVRDYVKGLFHLCRSQCSVHAMS